MEPLIKLPLCSKNKMNVQKIQEEHNAPSFLFEKCHEVYKQTFAIEILVIQLLQTIVVEQRWW